jgi:hypothetical protein
MVCPQVVAAVKEEHRPVAAVELDEVVAADDVARVARHCDYEIEGDIAGQHVEEVLTLHVSRKALLNDPKERIQGTEIVHGTFQFSVSDSTRQARLRERVLSRR